jgi:hypothetical protein
MQEDSRVKGRSERPGYLRVYTVPCSKKMVLQSIELTAS